MHRREFIKKTALSGAICFIPSFLAGATSAEGKDGFIFYDDHFGMKDQSSLRNHLCIAQDIPAKYIKDIKTF